jgi:hypothetical protein
LDEEFSWELKREQVPTGVAVPQEPSLVRTTSENTNRILFSKSLNVNMRGGDEKDGKPSTKNGEKGKPYTPAGYEESL